MTDQEDGGFTIEGADNVRRAHWLAVAHATALEINTGIKASRGSAVAACNRITGRTARTKKKALRDLVEHMAADFGYEIRPGASIERALR